MPKPKSLAGYNREYFTLCQVVAEQGLTLRLKLPKRKAEWMRHDIYAWRKALEREGSEELYRIAGAIAMRVDVPVGSEPDADAVLVIENRANTDTGRALTAAIKSATEGGEGEENKSESS